MWPPPASFVVRPRSPCVCARWHSDFRGFAYKMDALEAPLRFGDDIAHRSLDAWRSVFTRGEQESTAGPRQLLLARKRNEQTSNRHRQPATSRTSKRRGSRRTSRVGSDEISHLHTNQLFPYAVGVSVFFCWPPAGVSIGRAGAGQGSASLLSRPAAPIDVPFSHRSGPRLCPVMCGPRVWPVMCQAAFPFPSKSSERIQFPFSSISGSGNAAYREQAAIPFASQKYRE